MGYFYAGVKTNNSVNGNGKTGETNQKKLEDRIKHIRFTQGCFLVLKYLEIPNSTQAITRAVEGHVRMMLERDGYKNIQNDHFEFPTTAETKWAEFEKFTEKAMVYAIQYCLLMGIDYTLHEGDRKARRTVKHHKTA